ncbi:ferritin family protein [Candidatus Omnitrophota bacterium]
MASVFKISEIVDMGIEKEKARRDFYNLVSERFEDQNLKDVFTKLRDWEKEHIVKFQEIKSSISEPDAAESYKGELSDFMKTLVDDKLYKEVSPESFSENVTSPLSAIDYGIGFEKDAVLFFATLSRFTQSAKAEVIKQLIEEEKQHIVYLSELKKKLSP